MRMALIFVLGLAFVQHAGAVMQLPAYLAEGSGKTLKDHRYNPCGKKRTPKMCANPPKDGVAASAGLVVSSFMEDLTWLNEMYFEHPISVYVHDRSGKHRSHASADSHGDDPDIAVSSEIAVRAQNVERKFPVEFETIPNKGDEAAAYLAHIVSKYNKLPDITFFVQGHQCAAHAEFDMGRALPSIRECFPMWMGYMDLNTYHKKKASEKQPDCRKTDYLVEHPIRGFHIEHLEKLWTSLFEEHMGEFPARICWDSYAQFAVTRERILAHPVELYKKLLAGAMQGNTTMEFFWRMLFVPGASHKKDHTEENYNRMVEWVMNSRR
mmetsp:Transcript_93625/g.264783  ORF Transcript_93625/g.264783 Transcript_93625/m.264783 type:complete len:324 (+) Transcript_93625:64-1035(+)